MKLCNFCNTQTAKPCMTEPGSVGCRLLQRYRDRQEVTARADDQERSMNLRWMNDPDKWPRWPLLPLKKPDPRGQLAETGFLVCGKGPVVHLGSMYQVTPEWNDFKREPFESFAALYAAGWRID